jgi:hypothetical protein
LSCEYAVAPLLGSFSVPCFWSTAFPKLFLSVIVFGMLSLASCGVTSSPCGLAHVARPAKSLSTAVHTVHLSLANFVTFFIMYFGYLLHPPPPLCELARPAEWGFVYMVITGQQQKRKVFYCITTLR